tara:strand:- start:568 stop:747 length:180 start_codon:yes stop_codon:yes gene_type:complete
MVILEVQLATLHYDSIVVGLVILMSMLLILMEIHVLEDMVGRLVKVELATMVKVEEMVI